jgi:hypothetical protein
VFAQADFFDRLYIETGDGNERIRIDFGIYRAKLTLTNNGCGKVSRSPQLEGKNRNTYYANPDVEPLTHTIFVDAIGQHTLGEISLMPTEGQNRHAEIAVVSPDVVLMNLEAKIEVSFCSEGLYFFGEGVSKPSPSLAKKIAAIMLQLAKKDSNIVDSRIAVRIVPVKEIGT